MCRVWYTCEDKNDRCYPACSVHPPHPPLNLAMRAVHSRCVRAHSVLSGAGGGGGCGPNRSPVQKRKRTESYPHLFHPPRNETSDLHSLPRLCSIITTGSFQRELFYLKINVYSKCQYFARLAITPTKGQGGERRHKPAWDPTPRTHKGSAAPTRGEKQNEAKTSNLEPCQDREPFR